MDMLFRKKIWVAGIFLLVAVFVCSMFSCKSPESAVDVSAKIFVSNECGIDIDVYMDGVYQFSIKFLFYEVIENVPQGVYEIVAKIKDTDEVMSVATVDVYASGEYWVNILSDASLKIINEYGETLGIYMNGSYQGELADDDSQVFDNMPFGDHVLQASRPSSNIVITSATISITEEKEYAWTIKRIGGTISD